jgi:translation initiation factor 4A
MSDTNKLSEIDLYKYKSFSDIFEQLFQNIPDTEAGEKIKILYAKLAQGICDHGFDNPTLIQARTIIPLSEGKDIIAQSQAGTGKTGAFSIGLLTRINPERRYPQAIILATTRELASQINAVCKSISVHMNITTCLSIGGDHMSVNKNIHEAKKSHIIIGTPGRINNIIDSNTFKMKNIKSLILDEADALLSDDFVEQIKSIIVKLSGDAQICIFSATMDETTFELASNFIKDPLKITLEDDQVNLDSIRHYAVEIKYENDKIETLFDLYKRLRITQAVIFANAVSRAKYIYDQMTSNGHIVGLIHGQMSGEERCDTLKRFRKGELRALVATDIIARGIDVQQIGLVFNYDIPNTKETYLHRTGRSGRYGKNGVAINFAVTRPDSRNHRVKYTDYDKIDNISHHYQIKILAMPNPDKINDLLMGK